MFFFNYLKGIANLPALPSLLPSQKVSHSSCEARFAELERKISSMEKRITAEIEQKQQLVTSTPIGKVIMM
jgi:hypothetical protein